METINLSAYYDKISNIRNKILHKHREKPAEAVQKYLKDDPILQTNTQNPPTNPPTNHPTNPPSEDQTVRPPLEQKSSNQQNIKERLKELDSVNDKIKQILAHKRQPIANTFQKHTPPRKQSVQPPPKKLTSLFQNQNKIVESKVGPYTSQWGGKEKPIQQKQYRSNSIKNTVQSQYFTNEGIQTGGMLGTAGFNQFQSLGEQRNKQIGGSNKKSDNYDTYRLDIFNKRADLGFVGRNRQQLAEQKYPVQNSTKQKRQVKKQANLSGFSNNQETKKLVKLLSDQIAIDIKLREYRQTFDSYKSQSKWTKLKDEISKCGIQITNNDLERWIRISAEETNPFNDKTSQSQFVFSQLAAYFLETWNHWNHKLKNAVRISKLQEEGFKIKDIDLGEKGYITIEDLVCFINLHSDSCLRNRDVFCLFKRWNQCDHGQKVQNKLKYETFLNFVAE